MNDGKGVTRTMKPGVVLDLMTDYGATEELNVLCSFNYQHATVNAFNAIEENLSEEAKALSCFKTMESYRNNFENYISGNKNYD